MTYADMTPEPELSAADLQAAGGHPNRVGVKHDHGKRRWGLMPWAAAGAVVDVLDLARMVGHKDPRSLMIYYNATATEIANRLD